MIVSYQIPCYNYKGTALHLIELRHEVSNNVVCATSKPQFSLGICGVGSEPLIVT